MTTRSYKQKYTVGVIAFAAAALKARVGESARKMYKHVNVRSFRI